MSIPPVSTVPQARTPLPDIAPPPAVRPPARVVAELQLILLGCFGPLTGPLGRADTVSVRSRRRLADGTPWPVAVTLPIPREHAGSCPGSTTIRVEDPEGRPFADLAVTELWEDVADGTEPTLCAAGTLTAAPEVDGRAPTVAERRTGGRPTIAMVLDQPLQTADLEALCDAAASLDAEILLIPTTVEPGALGIPPHALMRTVLAAGPSVQPPARVVPVPLPFYADPLRRALAGVHVAAAYGADFVVLGGEDISGSSADELAVPVLIDADGQRCDVEVLAAALDEGDELPSDLMPAAVAEELRRARPPRTQRGLTVFLTGLSGSGKSTLARALHERLLQRGEVTLLDGDGVRDLLSRGLGFSREDRDLNVRRIGFVAAEVSRHGGTCVAAPIAPYAASRAAARSLVEQAGGGFVLVHVATPLAECERRDVKGLYARARAGELPAFTGVSDPYEEPTDADLVVDTTGRSIADCAEQVIDALRESGWLAAS